MFSSSFAKELKMRILLNFNIFWLEMQSIAIHFFKIQIRDAGANSSYHTTRDRVHPGQVYQRKAKAPHGKTTDWIQT